jgi:hypothetical protein
MNETDVGPNKHELVELSNPIDARSFDLARTIFDPPRSVSLWFHLKAII